MEQILCYFNVNNCCQQDTQHLDERAFLAFLAFLGCVQQGHCRALGGKYSGSRKKRYCIFFVIPSFLVFSMCRSISNMSVVPADNYVCLKRNFKQFLWVCKFTLKNCLRSLCLCYQSAVCRDPEDKNTTLKP